MGWSYVTFCFFADCFFGVSARVVEFACQTLHNECGVLYGYLYDSDVLLAARPVLDAAGNVESAGAFLSLFIFFRCLRYTLLYRAGACLPHNGNVHRLPDDARFAPFADGRIDNGSGVGQTAEYLCFAGDGSGFCRMFVDADARFRGF